MIHEPNPAEIIQQSREKAEQELLAKCADEVSRICSSFAQTTGLPVRGVEFYFMSFQRLGCRPESVLQCVRLHHEVA